MPHRRNPSTLHTNNAAGAVTRLIDMGVEPFLLASSLEGVLAQSNKVLVDVTAGNSLLYLPLNQLTGSAAEGAPTPPPPVFAGDAGQPAQNEPLRPEAVRGRRMR